MFTDREYRRQGIAKKLLTKVMEEAKNYGCGTVQITASDMGVLLYMDLGFEKNGNFMYYQLWQVKIIDMIKFHKRMDIIEIIRESSED